MNRGFLIPQLISVEEVLPQKDEEICLVMSDNGIGIASGEY